MAPIPPMKRSPLLVFTLFLAGCSTFAPNSTPLVDGSPLGLHHLSRPQRQQQLRNLQNWSSQGSIALRNSKKGWNASFAWRQSQQNSVLDLFGPLGTNHIQLTSAPGHATLKTTQQTYSAANAETLLEQHIGWQLPVNDLQYWLRGLPAPGTRTRQSYDMNNHLAQLTQQGWHLIYLRYISVNNVDLPDRILITSPEWTAHIIIHRWQFE